MLRMKKPLSALHQVAIPAFRICFLFFFFILHVMGFATTITSNTSGNWSSAGTWVGGVPTASVDVVIANGHNVTIDVSTANLGSITINATGTLTLNNSSFTVTANAMGTSKTITI